jgi:hypothetical protein
MGFERVRMRRELILRVMEDMVGGCGVGVGPSIGGRTRREKHRLC